MEENKKTVSTSTVSKKSFILTVAILSAIVIALSVGLVLSLVLRDNDDNVPSIYTSDDGFWVINGVKTNLKTNGEIDNGSVADENPQGLDFFLNAGGTYIVAAGSAKLFTEIIIPETYKGIPVTEIDEFGFGDNAGERPLVSMTIPDSITTIGNYAFVGCSSLTSIVLPDSVTSIGKLAFGNCSSLTSIEIPDSVTNIGHNAFYNCVSLTSIVIPDSVTSIDNNVFYVCSSLTSIVIPDSVTSIGVRAFNFCDSLADVYYTGSEEDWNKIEIGRYNEELTNATIHYNYVP